MLSEMREPLSEPPWPGSMTMVVGWKGSGGSESRAEWRRSAGVLTGTCGLGADVVVGVVASGVVESLWVTGKEF